MGDRPELGDTGRSARHQHAERAGQRLPHPAHRRRAGAAAEAAARGLVAGNETSSIRAGLPEGWSTADKTGNGDYGSTNDIGIAYGPQGQRLLLAIMTRSEANDPKAPNNRALMGEVAALLLPALLG
jgi:beta-lactamase class A